MDRSVDYNSVADEYDKRYETSDYGSVVRLLLDFSGETASARVLEVGCGTGQWLWELTRRGYRAFGLDPSRDMLKVAQVKAPQAAIVQAGAEAIPWQSGAFNRLFCINSLHHFADHRRFFAEARRLLSRGGGVLIVGLDPHNGLDRWWIYDYFPQIVEIDRRRYPSAERIRYWLKVYGFTECRTAIALHIPVQLPARAALESGRLAKETTSQLTLLSDGEYDAGINWLVKDIEAAEAEGKTLSIGADLRLYATTGWIR